MFVSFTFFLCVCMFLYVCVFRFVRQCLSVSVRFVCVSLLGVVVFECVFLCVCFFSVCSLLRECRLLGICLLVCV